MEIDKPIQHILLLNCRLLIKQERDQVRVTVVENATNLSRSALISWNGLERLPLVIEQLGQAIQQMRDEK